MMGAMKTAAWMRFVSVVLVVVLALSLGTPARADAMEIFTVLALVSVGVAVLILVVYLVVANVKGDKMSVQSDAPAMVACVDSDVSPRTCWPVSSVQEAVAKAKVRLPGATVMPLAPLAQAP